MGVPPAGAAATKPLVSHRPWTVVSGKTSRAQPRTRTTVSASAWDGLAHRAAARTMEASRRTRDVRVPSSADLPLSGIARHAAAPWCPPPPRRACARGKNVCPRARRWPRSWAASSPAASPWRTRTRTRGRTRVAAADAPAPDTRDSSGGAPDAPAAATDLQIVDEVWKVVDDNFLPARARSSTTRARRARWRDDYTKHPPATRGRGV